MELALTVAPPLAAHRHTSSSNCHLKEAMRGQINIIRRIERATVGTNEMSDKLGLGYFCVYNT